MKEALLVEFKAIVETQVDQVEKQDAGGRIKDAECINCWDTGLYISAVINQLHCASLEYSLIILAWALRLFLKPGFTITKYIIVAELDWFYIELIKTLQLLLVVSVLRLLYSHLSPH